MKKLVKLSSAMLFVGLMLMACSNNADNHEEEAKETNATVNENEKTDTNENEGKPVSDIDRVIDEVIETNTSLESFVMIEETNTKETFQDQVNEYFTKEASKIVLNPFQLEVMIEQSQPKGATKEEREAFNYEGAFYIVDGKTYMQLDGNTWTETENNQTDEEILEQEVIAFDTAIKGYREAAAEESMEEIEDSYVLQFELVPAQATKMDKASKSRSFESLIETYQVEEMTVSLTVDKETMYLEEVFVEKVYSYEEDFEMEKDTMKVEVEEKIIISEQNSLEAITVPTKVKENAEKM